MFYGVRLQVKNPKIWIDAAIFDDCAGLIACEVQHAAFVIRGNTVPWHRFVYGSRSLRPIAVHSRPNWRLVMPSCWHGCYSNIIRPEIRGK